MSPSPSVTASATATPSVSPSPTALSEEELLALIPSAARTDSFAGASEFVEFMLEQYVAAYATGDPSLWKAVSSEDCGFCASVIDESKALAASGGRRTGGVLAVTDVLGLGGASDDGFTYVSRTYSVTETRDLDAAGNTVGEAPAGTGTASFKLKYDGQAWIVYGIETVGD